VVPPCDYTRRLSMHVLICRGKDSIVLRMELRRSAHLPFPGHWAHRWIYHWFCDSCPLASATPVTFPAIEHHRPLAGTNLYCFVNRGTRVWGSFVKRSGRADSKLLRPIGCKSDALTTTPARHTVLIGLCSIHTVKQFNKQSKKCLCMLIRMWIAPKSSRLVRIYFQFLDFLFSKKKS